MSERLSEDEIRREIAKRLCTKQNGHIYFLTEKQSALADWVIQLVKAEAAKIAHDSLADMLKSAEQKGEVNGAAAMRERVAIFVKHSTIPSWQETMRNLSLPTSCEDYVAGQLAEARRDTLVEVHAHGQSMLAAFEEAEAFKELMDWLHTEHDQSTRIEAARRGK